MSDEHGLGELLRDEVPAPGPSYWEDIDSRLVAAAGESAAAVRDLDDHSQSSGSDVPVVLLTDAKTPSSGSGSSAWPLVVAVAAVLLVIAGVLGIFGVREGTPTQLDITDDPSGEIGETDTEVPAEPEQEDPPVVPAEEAREEEALEAFDAPEDEILGVDGNSESITICYGPEFPSPAIDSNSWIVQFVDGDFVSLEEFPAFEDRASIITTGTLETESAFDALDFPTGSAVVRSVGVPNGRTTEMTWFFDGNRVETPDETVGIETDCFELDNLDDLLAQLTDEHQALLAQEAALNVVEGEAGRVATTGEGADLEQVALSVLPGPEAGEAGTVAANLNNVQSTGRTATVDGVGYTEVQTPTGFGIARIGWISDELLADGSSTLAEIAETRSGAAFGVVDEVLPPGDEGLIGLVIEGEIFLISATAEIVEGGSTLPGATIDEALLSSTLSVEFVVEPEFEDFGTITMLRIVGILAG